jgi:hypothetical protein
MNEGCSHPPGLATPLQAEGGGGECRVHHGVAGIVEGHSMSHELVATQFIVFA